MKRQASCPKVMARIGRFAETLADRRILIRMHRKAAKEECAHSRDLDALTLRHDWPGLWFFLVMPGASRPFEPAPLSAESWEVIFQ